MNTENIGLIIGAIGSLASIAGLVAAAIQTIRINRLKKEEKLDVWNIIRHSKQIKHQIAESEKLDHPSIARAYEANQSLFRTQLKRAVLLEKKYTTQTIEKWKEQGKISGEWEEKQALNYLDTGA